MSRSGRKRWALSAPNNDLVRAVQLRVLPGELLQCLTAQPIGQPVADPLEADALVEAAGRVPVEHVEVDALESSGEAFLGERLHECARHAAAALLRDHPDILDEDAARGGPDRVVEGVEREADRHGPAFGDQGDELRLLAEAVARQGLRRRGDGIGLVLVGREIDREAMQQLDIVDRRQADGYGCQVVHVAAASFRASRTTASAPVWLTSSRISRASKSRHCSSLRPLWASTMAS